MKDAEANEQHKSIIGTLKAAALEWEFEQINLVVGDRGLVVQSDFYTKLKKLDIQEGKKDKLFADHVTQVCEVHNRVIVSFLQHVQGGTRPTTEGSREKGTMRTCEEIEIGTHACKASKLGPVNDGGLRTVNWESQSKTPPQNPEDRHIYCILLVRIAFCHVSENLPLCCLFIL